MTITHFAKIQAKNGEDNLGLEFNQFLLSLPREKGWRTTHIYQFQGFWCQPEEIHAIMSFQKHFKPKDSDVIISSIPKSGTTWLKALAFAIVNRKCFPVSSTHHPLLSYNPHDLVPFFEYKLYANNQVPDLSNMPEKRLFGTHIPFASMPSSIKKSNCKIVYICRNPFDTFISSWHFLNKIKPSSMPSMPLEEAFDMYCNGVIGYGPFWTHMLGYWKKSLENPRKVLFLKYEDVRGDASFHIERLAKFLDCPFSLEEKRKGVIEKIGKLCSFENMKELEVNKTGKSIKNFDNKSLFRKGEIGDWVNYLSPQMVDRLYKVIEDKLGGSGLSFRVFS